MYWYGRFLLLVLLLIQGNGEKQQVPQALPLTLLKDKTMVEVEVPSIPDALKGLHLSVYDIDNESHIVYINLSIDQEGCLPRLFLQRRLYNSSNIHPFEYDYHNMPPQNVTFFNRSSAGSHSCPILALGSHDSVLLGDLVSSTMIFRFPLPIPADHLQKGYLQLKLSQPKTIKHILPVVSVPPKATVLRGTGPVVMALLLIVCVSICIYVKKKRDDQARLEKFLADYKALKPTRFSYADIKRITGQFKHKIGEGAYGTVFKGKLSTEIQVAVKVLNNHDGKDFLNEIGTMGKIHHINVVRLLGFCVDGFHRALVYNFFPNGSLQKFISSPDNKAKFLGWSKLQQIALDIAKGIEYLHQGCDYRILHFDINPRNVLLDHNFTPKISDFGLAKLCLKNESIVSMTTTRGTLGYIAPEVFSRNFGNVTCKSDIYSYGMMLLEMVGGRKNADTNKETFQVLYPEWIHNLIDGGDISIYIEDEVDVRIAKKLAIVGLWCIQWHVINRPSIKMVIQMLEGEVDKLKVPPTSFDYTTSINACTTGIPPRHLNSELDVIDELE